MTGAAYSAWHYAPDALPRFVARPDGRFDLHLVIGAWSPVPVEEKVAVRWSVRGRSSAESAVPAEEVTALDDEFEKRLQLLDAAPDLDPGQAPA